MTLESKHTKVVYLPDGVQTRYSVGFPLFSPQDVACVYVDAAGRESEINDFNVQGYGTQGGVYVVFAVAPPAGGSLVIVRRTRQVQESAYPEGGKFPSAVVERDFDRVVGMIQEAFENLERCLKVNVSEDQPIESLDELYARLRAVLEEAQAASSTAADVLEKINNMGVVVVPIDCMTAPYGEYDASNGVFTFYLPFCQEGGGSGGDIFISDAIDGHRGAAERVVASEKAVGEVNARLEQAVIDTGPPLLTPIWSLFSEEPGFIRIDIDNGDIPEASFSAVYAKLARMQAAGEVTVVDFATWDAEKAANGGVVNKFGLDADAKTFRLPIWTKRVSCAAPDPEAQIAPGMYAHDRMRPITGSWGDTDYAFFDNGNRFTGVFKRGQKSRYREAFNADAASSVVEIDSALLGPNYAGDITHGPLVILYPMLKMYGQVAEASEANIAALIQATTGKLDTGRFEQNQQMLHVRDEKPSGTPGGSINAGAWRTRDLNTVVNNSIPGSSLANNKITLPAGAYRVQAYAPGLAIYEHRIRLMDVSHDQELALGTSSYAGAGDTPSQLWGEIVLSGTSEIELQQYCNASRATNGMGQYTSDGRPCVFAQVWIARVV